MARFARSSREQSFRRRRAPRPELAVLRLFLDNALALEQMRFARPPDEIGLALMGEKEWDPWVRRAAGEVAHVDLTGLTMPALVSFLG